MPVINAASTLVAVLAMVACQPWYRDDLRHGREARETKRIDRLLEDAAARNRSGDPTGAARLALRAIEIDPFATPDVYLKYAGYSLGAGRGDEARAVIRWRLTRSASESERARMREFLIASFVTDDRIADALDLAAPGDLLQATTIEILRAPLADLAAAVTTSADEPAEALVLYIGWESTYGIPDHPLLAKARDQVLASASNMSRWTKGCGIPAPTQLAALRRTNVPISTPAREVPLAYRLALAGDDALKSKRLGPAIRSYLRAVALAPGWKQARDNLEALLGRIGRRLPAPAPEADVSAMDEASACAEAAAYHRRRCSAGRSEDCKVVADLVAAGRGVARDANEACKLGHATSCREVAGPYERQSTAVAADAGKAESFRRRAAEMARQRCERGDWKACDAHVEKLSAGDAARGRRAAERIWERGCKAKAAEPCIRLAQLGLADASERRRARALAALERECAAGAVSACESLRVAFQPGGPLADPVKAAAMATAVAELVRKGCDGSDLGHCRRAAAGYRTGAWGLPVDSSAAARTERSIRQLETKACDAGDDDACSAVAERAATAPDRNGVKLIEIVERACEGGSIAACDRAAALHASGIGESDGYAASNREAARLYERGCSLGDAESCARLAELERRAGKL